MAELMSGSSADIKDILSLKKIRAEATKKIREIKLKNKIRLAGYLPAERKEDFWTAVEWAYRNKLIKKPTQWSFVNMCVLNVVDMVAKQANAEKALGTMAAPVETPITASEPRTPPEDSTIPQKSA